MDYNLLAVSEFPCNFFHFILQMAKVYWITLFLDWQSYAHTFRLNPFREELNTFGNMILYLTARIYVQKRYWFLEV